MTNRITKFAWSSDVEDFRAQFSGDMFADRSVLHKRKVNIAEAVSGYAVAAFMPERTGSRGGPGALVQVRASASGRFNQELQAEFTQSIEHLLAEPGAEHTASDALHVLHQGGPGEESRSRRPSRNSGGHTLRISSYAGLGLLLAAELLDPLKSAETGDYPHCPSDRRDAMD